MDDATIQYRIGVGEQETVFEIDPLRKQSLKPSTPLPSWARLTHHQCGCCPLAPQDNPWCPAASDLAEMLEVFADLPSTILVSVEVKTAQRTIVKDCDIQTVLGSLAGLLMASSACPVLARLRPLALHHLPFADPEETLVRTVAFELLRQLLAIRRKTGSPDFELEELRAFYNELGQLNIDFTDRIREAGQGDAATNALTRLFSLSHLVGNSIDDLEAELARFLGL